MVQSLGFAIYRALDWGLDESEERELSPQLERLIDLMANSDCEDGGCSVADEGYGGPEEEEEAEGGPRAVRTFAQAMRLCAARLTDPRGAQAHYQAVCRALFVETLELRAFLARVREAKEVSRQACGEGQVDRVRRGRGHGQGGGPRATVVSKREGWQEEAGGAKVVSGVQGDGGLGRGGRVCGLFLPVLVPLSSCLFPGEWESTLCSNPHNFLPSFTPERGNRMREREAWRGLSVRYQPPASSSPGQVLFLLKMRC